jgi:hypothetical protein
MTTDLLLAGLGTLAALVLALAAWVAVLQRRLTRTLEHYRRLTDGVHGGRLDEVLDAHVAASQAAAAAARHAAERCDVLEAQLQAAFTRSAVVRFNPFDDTGSNQSFAIAVTNARGDGFVLSTLHGRSGTRIYAKPVRGGTSRYPLSREEEQALLEASISATG